MNVIPISEDCTTPANVLHHVNNRTNIKEIYVVTIADTGHIDVYASGDLRDLATAALALENVARDFTREKMSGFVEDNEA